jgi:hypothetical protein
VEEFDINEFTSFKMHVLWQKNYHIKEFLFCSYLIEHFRPLDLASLAHNRAHNHVCLSATTRVCSLGRWSIVGVQTLGARKLTGTTTLRWKKKEEEKKKSQDSHKSNLYEL